LAEDELVAGAGPGEADEVFGADVGGEEGGADYEPADVAAGEEVAGGGLAGKFGADGGADGYAEDSDEVECDDDPVQGIELAH